jgi:hypothetical protein
MTSLLILHPERQSGFMKDRVARSSYRRFIVSDIGEDLKQKNVPVSPKKTRSDWLQAKDRRQIFIVFLSNKCKCFFLTGTYNDGSFSAVIASMDRFAGCWRASDCL